MSETFDEKLSRLRALIETMPDDSKSPPVKMNSSSPGQPRTKEVFVFYEKGIPFLAVENNTGSLQSLNNGKPIKNAQLSITKPKTIKARK